MQDIREESLNESVKSEQSPRVVLWEIDLTVQGGERYFFCHAKEKPRYQQIPGFSFMPTDNPVG